MSCNQLDMTLVRSRFSETYSTKDISAPANSFAIFFLSKEFRCPKVGLIFPQ